MITLASFNGVLFVAGVKTAVSLVICILSLLEFLADLMVISFILIFYHLLDFLGMHVKLFDTLFVGVFDTDDPL